MSKGMKMLLIAPFAIAGMALICFVAGEIVKQLWNWLMPSIFGLRQLTFWESAGMLALCRILFGGIAGRGLAGSNARHRTAERREEFRQRVRERFGFGAAGADHAVPK